MADTAPRASVALVTALKDAGLSASDEELIDIAYKMTISLIKQGWMLRHGNPFTKRLFRTGS